MPLQLQRPQQRCYKIRLQAKLHQGMRTASSCFILCFVYYRRMNSRAEEKEPYRLEKSQPQVRSRKARKLNRNAYSGSTMQCRGQVATVASKHTLVIWGKSFQVPLPGKSLRDLGQWQWPMSQGIWRIKHNVLSKGCIASWAMAENTNLYSQVGEGPQPGMPSDPRNGSYLSGLGVMGKACRRVSGGLLGTPGSDREEKS